MPGGRREKTAKRNPNVSFLLIDAAHDEASVLNDLTRARESFPKLRSYNMRIRQSCGQGRKTLQSLLSKSAKRLIPPSSPRCSSFLVMIEKCWIASGQSLQPHICYVNAVVHLA